MSSKIKQELLDVLDISAKAKESAQDLSIRIVKGVAELADADWDGLSPEAQSWFNDAADAVNSKKAAPAFPDEKTEEAATSSRRSRKAADEEEPEETKQAEADAPAEPVVGDTVKVVTNRDKETTGKVVEIDDEIMVLEVGDEELEFQRERLKSETVIPVETKKSRSSRKAAEPDPEDAEETDAEPVVGDQVLVITKRGKEVKGELLEIDDGLYIIKTEDDEVEIDPTTAKSVEVIKVTKTETKKSRGSKSPEADTADEADTTSGKTKRTSTADNGGVSATMRMRELIVENIDEDKDAIRKLLAKEKITYRDNTLDLVFADAHKLIKILKDRKLLK